MNEYIEEQLKKTKTVSFYNKDGKQITLDNLKDKTYLIIKQKDFSNKQEDLLLFTFEDYLIKPFNGFDFHEKFNRGINIPLKVMQGRILRTVGKMYYIKVKGFYFKNDTCIHCLKKEESNPVCLDCFKALNVNDIEDIEWEGYVPQKSCKLESI
ncbi:hypothetical protein [uncultured Clostridium sp.]|uniref:hypothetical protein n=1 Tax=uncultured Clostridium sp. TaxID=59620 RepID=UPI00262DCA03|nr:hypothetical protein [uncultured Clostridium sp.]